MTGSSNELPGESLAQAQTYPHSRPVSRANRPSSVVSRQQPTRQLTHTHTHSQGGNVRARRGSGKDNKNRFLVSSFWETDAGTWDTANPYLGKVPEVIPCGRDAQCKMECHQTIPWILIQAIVRDGWWLIDGPVQWLLQWSMTVLHCFSAVVGVVALQGVNFFLFYFFGSTRPRPQSETLTSNLSRPVLSAEWFPQREAKPAVWLSGERGETEARQRGFGKTRPP